MSDELTMDAAYVNLEKAEADTLKVGEWHKIRLPFMKGHVRAMVASKEGISSAFTRVTFSPFK